MFNDYKTDVVEHPSGGMDIEVNPTKWYKVKHIVKIIAKYLLDQWIGLAGLIVAVIALLHSTGYITL